MFVYLPNTSHFIHVKPVRQKKWTFQIPVALPVKTSPDYVVKVDSDWLESCRWGELLFKMYRASWLDKNTIIHN